MAVYYVSDLNHCLDNIIFREVHQQVGDETYIINDRSRRDFDYKKHGSPIGIEGNFYDVEMEETIDDVFRLIHYHQIYKNITEADEVTTTLINNEAKSLVRKFYKKPNARKLGNKEGMSFYTIMPKARIPISEVEVGKMRDFCEKFFTNKYFLKCWWVIESGKHEKSPNLHIHLLGQFKWKSPDESMSKNFKRNLITSWNKHYQNPKYDISYKEPGNFGIHHVPCNTDQIRNDKLSYMTNSEKGTHENFIDLGVKGGFS